MKLPTEAELIELENRVLKGYQVSAKEFDGYGPADRIARTLETLIAFARDPSRLLENIPLDDALDRATQQQRTSNPEPSSSARPKLVKKGKKR